MKNVEDFQKLMVRIDEQPDGSFGHYPFQMFVETAEGSNNIMALALGGDVVKCYNLFKKEVWEKAKRVYMSLDFPANPEIKDDFVAIFSWDLEEEKVEIKAIPYNTKTGEVLSEIKSIDSKTLTAIAHQFYQIIKEKP